MPLSERVRAHRAIFVLRSNTKVMVPPGRPDASIAFSDGVSAILVSLSGYSGRRMLLTFARGTLHVNVLIVTVDIEHVFIPRARSL